MGQVVPFIARMRDSGEWSATERARLESLAEQLAAAGVRVEVIFGATDDGDPWCVVTDDSGDVLIHVARIGDRFVVHSAVDDTVGESADLQSALRDRMVATEDAVAPQSATILPFGLTARQGQTFLALLAATAFFYETAGFGETAQAAEAIDLSPPAETPALPDDDPAVQARETVAQAAAPQPAPETTAPVLAPSMAEPAATPTPVADDLPEAVETSAPEPEAHSAVDLELVEAPPPSEAPETIQGTDGDDRLVGSAADEHILGGAGNDTLIGGGGNDTLDGGAGDDLIEITSGTLAIGGAGADTFVIQAPVVMGRADMLLGRIADFAEGEGDRIFSFTGLALRPPPPDSGDKPLRPDGGREGLSGFTSTGATGDPGSDPLRPAGGDVAPPDWTRMDVDLDGDGRSDGYLLVHVRGPAPGAEPPVGVVGQALTTPDPFG